MAVIGNWKLVVLERFAKFDGRAGREEFWFFVLANVAVYLVLLILAQISSIFVALYFIYWLATVVPSVAVGIRRLHDTDKTGWFLLLGFVPFIGGIILLVFFAMQGTEGPNQFGAAADPAAP